MYDESMLFTANEINRFSIGSTTDGLAPSNWLLAPAGPFNLTMRYYTPLAPVLDKTYRLPAVRKT